jgi:hypothetical protein
MVAKTNMEGSWGKMTEWRGGGVKVLSGGKRMIRGEAVPHPQRGKNSGCKLVYIFAFFQFAAMPLQTGL